MHVCPGYRCGYEMNVFQKDGYIERYCCQCGKEDRLENGKKPERTDFVGAGITSLASKKREKQGKMKAFKDRGNVRPQRGMR